MAARDTASTGDAANTLDDKIELRKSHTEAVATPATAATNVAGVAHMATTTATHTVGMWPVWPYVWPIIAVAAVFMDHRGPATKRSPPDPRRLSGKR